MALVLCVFCASNKTNVNFLVFSLCVGLVVTPAGVTLLLGGCVDQYLATKCGVLAGFPELCHRPEMF